MSKIEQSIDVNVPVREAYNQWTQFEDFPHFMSGVESVKQVGDTHLHWIATIAGKRTEWDAEIAEQTPDKRVAWTSTSGDPNAGAVDFHYISENKTRVTLTMDVQPQGAVEKVGDALGFPDRQVKGDLEKFKEFIESRGTATGAWRGQVQGGQASGGSTGSTGGSTGSMGSGSMGSTGSVGSDFGTGSDLGTSSTGSGFGTGTSTGSDFGTGTDRGTGSDLGTNTSTSRTGRESETGF